MKNGARAACMSLVELPLHNNRKYDSADSKYIQDLLHFKYSTEVPIKNLDGKLYIRISSHIYNRISDYEAIAKLIPSIKLV